MDRPFGRCEFGFQPATIDPTETGPILRRRIMRRTARVAGQVGADHWLLGRLGIIGQPGCRFTRRHMPTTPTQA
jgi:hypothetical protein